MKEFQSLCVSKDVRYIFRYTEDENLQYMIDKYEVTTLEQFDTLSNNVKYTLTYFKEQNLQYAVHLYQVTTPEQFGDFCTRYNIRDVLTHVKEQNLQYIIDLYNVTTPEEFEDICSNVLYNDSDAKYVLSYITEQNLQYAVHLYQITTPEQFEDLCSKDDVIELLTDANWQKLQYAIDLYQITTPEQFEDLCKSDNLKYILKHGKQKNIEKIFYIYQTQEQKTQLLDFLNKKVFTSKRNTKTLFNAQYNIDFKTFQKIFLYYIENKQKSLLSMIETLIHIDIFGLNVYLDTFKTIDDFKDINWEIDFAALRSIFKKILQLHNIHASKKLLNQFDNCVKTKNIESCEKLLIENFIQYFDLIYHKKLKIKILSSLKKFLWDNDLHVDNIDNAKIDRADFIEAYKMSLNPQCNKQQINILLRDYLMWKYDNIEALYQYNTPKNKDWLQENLDKNQQMIWLSKNTMKIDFKNNWNKNWQENKDIQINNYFEIAIQNIQHINLLWFEFQTHFTKAWELVQYFDAIIKQKQGEIACKDTHENLFEDLKLQVNSIKQSFKTRKTREVSQIIIEKELDPLKSLMMWNWVNGSCLSYYSNVWNYYSAISNTIDVNKWVFYIKDNNWNILWRCIITIWNDKKISRYKMYYRWNVQAPINQYFDNYVKQLAHKLWLEINGDEYKVQNIQCDHWYKDGIKKIT